MKRALILVDIQNDFMPGGALPTRGGDREGRARLGIASRSMLRARDISRKSGPAGLLARARASAGAPECRVCRLRPAVRPDHDQRAGCDHGVEVFVG